MKNKNSKSEKKTLKKQLISGGVYIALSAVAVAVTVNTAVSMFSGNNELPPMDNVLDNTQHNSSLDLPKVPESLVLPQLDTSVTDSLPTIPQSSTPVADSPSGVSAEIVDDTADIPKVAEISDTPLNSDLTDEKFILPCDGFVTVEHSVDIPVYSPTFCDFRTHTGVDIAADQNTPVKASRSGVITQIYTDDLYGSSMSIETPDGYTLVYSNLSEELPDGIAEGIQVSSGTVIGSIGTSAIAEANQESHLHFEIYKDCEPMNPVPFLY